MIEPAGWVVDTNVLVSRLLLPGSVPARAVDLALSEGILLFSDATLTELTRVMSRPKFDPYISREDRKSFIRLLGGISRIVPVVRSVHACRDPNDDKFLDIALAGPAQALITGDRDLLALSPFHGIEIIAPAAFLDRTKPVDD